MLSVEGYEQVRELVVGDLARVVLARESATGRSVVIKWMHDDLFADDTVREVFLQELRRFTELDHPNLAHTIRAGLHAHGKIYVVQEFVDGKTSADLVRAARIPPARALTWARQAALALEQAWSRIQRIHGHLHPDNIMIDSEGRARVTDLGLSRLVARLTSDGTPDAHAPLRGLRHYLAPEQVQGAGACDARTDIYALGLVLYTWVTGLTPFGDQWNEDPRSLMETGRVQAPSLCAPGIGAPFETLLSAMTARDRAERLPDWETVLRELAAVEGGRRPVHAPPPDSIVPTCTDTERAERPARAAPAERRNGTPQASRTIVLSAAQQAALRQARPARPYPVFWYAITAALVLSATVLYGLHRYSLVDLSAFGALIGRDATPNATPAMSELPDHTISFRAEPTLPPARPTVARKIEMEADDTAPGPSSRQDPTFVRAARSFNAALELYADYQQKRDDPAQLRRIESLTQSALTDFQATRDRHPNRRDVLQYIDQCYGMIRYARQTLLMDHGLAGRAGTASRHETRRQTRAASEASLRLAPGWKASPHPEAMAAAEEMLVLLGAYGTARVDLSGQPHIDVFPAIRYLMPVVEAAALYQVELPEGLLIRHPAFPAETVRVYSVDGAFPGGWPRLRFFTDVEGQIIAAQGLDEEPESVRLAASLFSPRWQLSDPGSGRAKPNAELMVAHQVRKVGAVVQLESEVMEPDPETEDRGGKAVFRSVLFLPQPVVDVMLSRLSGR